MVHHQRVRELACMSIRPLKVCRPGGEATGTHCEQIRDGVHAGYKKAIGPSGLVLRAAAILSASRLGAVCGDSNAVRRARVLCGIAMAA